MKTIKYKIELYSYWHCGAGLAAGADVDALVVKDSQMLPYIPGKTLKGLIREAVVDYMAFAGVSDPIKAGFKEAFGDDTGRKGASFFKNAELSAERATYIAANRLQEFLYTSLAATAIDETGIAKENSLRKMEVAVPCTLESCVADLPDEIASTVAAALGLVKRLGQGRNRGLGRCQFTDIEITDTKKGGER